MARAADVDLRGAPRTRGGACRRASIAASRYRELADTLVPYVQDMGFTHIELLPVMEHPFSRLVGLSGGRATSRRPAASARPTTSATSSTRAIGSGIGVILDWVPGHFPKDAHGLARFDGTALYEHADPRQGEHHRLGHADLQLRPQRGAELPAQQRAVLARGVPHRRPARRRRGVDALPRLLAQARASGCPTSTAAARTSRRSSS